MYNVQCNLSGETTRLSQVNWAIFYTHLHLFGFVCITQVLAKIKRKITIEILIKNIIICLVIVLCSNINSHCTMCKGFTALQESDKTLICFHHSYHDHESETKGKFSRLVQNRRLNFFLIKEKYICYCL